MRLTMMYGTEWWVLNKKKETEMKVAEMRILKWMRCSVTRLNRNGNEYITGSLGVTTIAGKTRDNKPEMVKTRWEKSVRWRDSQEYR